MVRSKYSRGFYLGSILIFILAFDVINGLQEVRPSGENSVSDPKTEHEVEYVDDFEVEDDTEEDDKNKFTWRHHDEDHGIYAHKSLMSTANIKSKSETDEDFGIVDKNGNKVDANRAKVKSDDDLDPRETVDYPEKEWQLMFRGFDLALDSFSGSVLKEIGDKSDILNEIVSRLEPECKRDIYHIKDSVKKHKLWALRMLDSNGKLPSGIVYGKFSSPGDYEECLAISVNEKIYNKNTSIQPEHYKFRGKYCLLDFRLPLPERPKDKLLGIHDPVLNFTGYDIGDKFPEIANYSGYAAVFYEAGYMHAFCLPTSCDVNDLVKSVGLTLENLHIIVNSTVDCEQRFDEPQPLRTSQIISLSLLTLIFANASLATIIYHYLSKDKMDRIRERHREKSSGRPAQSAREKLKQVESLGFRGSSFRERAMKVMKKYQAYADCFSIQKNFERLTKPDPRGLTFVHYTRIIAMGLTVITHTGALGTLQALTKPADASNSDQIFRDFLPQMLANAFTSIQIFFFMAGFMLVISTYPSIKRDKGHLSFLEYAIKRAIRLMPGLAATVCLNFIWPLIVDGPMLSYFTRAIVIPCETNWWRTMGFLSNFDHVEKMCLRHSYFSASDYQLHIMAFPLLILLYKQPTVALFLAALATVGGFVAQVIMVLTKPLLPFIMLDYIDKEAFFNVVHYIHHPVWNHMSAFFYGFIVGYMVVRQIRVNLSPTTIRNIWIVIIPAGVVSIYAPYFWNHYKRPIFKWQMVLYVIFDRFILLTTCAWLSYATMVLARPVKKPKLPQPVLNLPAIVTLEHGKDGEPPEVPQDGTVSPQATPTTGHQQLKPSGSLASLPRQRSSPNIQTINLQQGSPPKLRPAISSANVSTAPIEADGSGTQIKQKSEQISDSASQGGRDEKPIEVAAQPRRSQAPISNVNTLCLVLSRLTFQLYLFNMVVLWVDVNHSKYFWFFSYYFIITKAFAVYICTAIMATIFFITLESPSLTLYIIWVKSRAQARADKKTKRDEEKEASEVDKSSINLKQINLSAPQAGNKTTSLGIVNHKSNFGGSFDGLCMKMGTPEATDKPAFSFIDLSAPPSSIKDTNDQTKM